MYYVSHKFDDGREISLYSREFQDRGQRMVRGWVVESNFAGKYRFEVQELLSAAKKYVSLIRSFCSDVIIEIPVKPKRTIKIFYRNNPIVNWGDRFERAIIVSALGYDSEVELDPLMDRGSWSFRGKDNDSVVLFVNNKELHLLFCQHVLSNELVDREWFRILSF